MRFPIFETGYDEFLYATHGGTIFLVKYQNVIFGITCKHVIRDFNIEDLRISLTNSGRACVTIEKTYQISSLRSELVGSDFLDILILRILDNTLEIFQGDIYPIEPNTVGMGEISDRLAVCGFIKEKSFISPPNIFSGLYTLEFKDLGPTDFDPVLRQGIEIYDDADFGSISGLSGAPVYNINLKILCGMVVRGALHEGNVCNIFYVSIDYIIAFLDTILTEGL